MINLTTIIQTLGNIRDKLKKVLVGNPNSDLAVSLVKLNAVISELKSLQQEIDGQRATQYNDNLIRLIVRMAKKDVAFTEEEAVKYFHKEAK